MYAVILAGGSGTRFWPLSRKKTPKQFLKLYGSRTLIEETVLRLKPVIPMEKIVIVTTSEHKRLIKRLLKHIPVKNLIVEPAGRNTAPAIGLAAMKLKNEDDVMGVFPSDHIVMNNKKFLDALIFSEKLARMNDMLVTLGMKPNRPETGYGYIEAGKPFARQGSFVSYRVKRFVEKPDLRRAKRYFKNDRFYWNSGMFIWRTRTFLEALKENLPDVYKKLGDAILVDKRGVMNVDEMIYRKVQNISVDYGIMEKAHNTVVVPVDINWTDVGAWEALKDIAKRDGNGNVVLSKDSVLLDVEDSIFFAKDKFIAGIGVKNIILVNSEDAILICRKDMSQRVRELVTKLKLERKDKYL